MNEFKPLPVVRLASDRRTVLWAPGNFIRDDSAFYPDAWKQPIASITRHAIEMVMDLQPKR
jgi:hypothetical protein